MRLAAYDLLGREVARVLDETLLAGTHEAVWQPEKLPSGTYELRLTSGTEHRALRVTHLR